MKKPLLNAKEYDQLLEFSTNLNLSLLPKLLPIPISISSTEVTQKSVFETKLMAQLKNHKILNKDPSRPVYYYDFQVTTASDEFKYEPGDSFGFFPELLQEDVEDLAKKLGIPNLKEFVNISGPKEIISSFFPSESSEMIITIDDILRRIDLRSFPKKAILRTLAEYCSNESDGNLLLFLSSRNGSDAYNRLRGEMFSGQIILAAIDSVRSVPIEVLASLFGPLQPRYYSCCRAMNLNCDSFQIVFNLSEGSPESFPSCKITGVCSSWLENLSKSKTEGTLIPIQKRSINQFRLPQDLNDKPIPIIMIACGTGIAPFIGFLEIIQKQKSSSFNSFNWLIFGLRSCKTDFIFQEEIEKFLQNGTLSKLSLAQSRDPDVPKEYVQDVLKKEKAEFINLINEKEAIIYVCGDELTMIKGVNDFIIEIIKEIQPELNQKDAEGLLMKWTKEKKIIRDIWI